MSFGATDASSRKLYWVERPAFSGWACSECTWAFHPVGSLGRMSIHELVEKTQKQLDEDFVSTIAFHDGPVALMIPQSHI
jgi:hypothetical protein